ncbi:MAG: DNA repair exonuclease [Firmicutes bacterium]|nr:DNA repair exonuclease [Bacillota bacterium]
MAIRILHTADLHLDRPFLGLGARRTARRAEMRQRFEEILALAVEKEVAGLIIAGDLFDRPAADSGLWVKAKLKELTARGIEVFLVPGNHDPLGECGFYHGEFPAGVHVFKEESFVACETLPGVVVYGRAFSRARQTEDPLTGLTFLPGEGRRHIAVIHGQLRTAPAVAEDYAPFTSAAIAASNLDYLALGHYHSFLDCSAGRTRAFYPGSPHRLDFGDRAERRALLVTLSAEGVEVEPISLPDRPFLELEGDLARPEKLYEELGRLDPRAYIRVRLTGHAVVPTTGLVADLEEKFADRYFGFEVVLAEEEPAYGTEDRGPVAEAFLRRMAARLAAAGDPEEAATVRLAMDYGLMALEGRDLP